MAALILSLSLVQNYLEELIAYLQKITLWSLTNGLLHLPGFSKAYDNFSGQFGSIDIVMMFEPNYIHSIELLAVFRKK